MFEFTPAHRKFIYGLVALAVPMLVAYGTITDVMAAQILNAVAALLSIGGSALAFKNVPDQD
jgi:hypothetical protein